MTEYKEQVEKHRKLMEAEKWARGVQHIHVHQLTSMWYEQRPYDMEDGAVTDTIFNDGTIQRRLPSGGLVFLENERLMGDELIDAWEKATYNSCICGEQDCDEEYEHWTHGY